jgi:nucleotide-binding universal stress UspA family protein
MFKNILVPLDGSALSEKALNVAIVIAKAFDAKITLLHNISITSFTSVGASMGEETYQQIAESDALNSTDYLKKVEGRLHGCGVTNITTQVVEGIPTSAIQLAVTNGVDLIVMTTHARTGIARTILGSVADEVVRSVNIPVLLVSAQQPELEPGGCVPAFHRILVPLDGSTLALQALPIASALAQATGAGVVLLDVLPEPALVGEELATGGAGWACRYLNEAAHTLPPGIEADTVFTSGNVGEAIVREAMERDCDLIVMTTHGRSGFSRMRLGSVADQVLAHAPVPLLLLHGDSAEAAN